MKSLLYTIVLSAFICTLSSTANAQGCVAVKNMSSCSMHWGDEDAKALQVSLNYRYFRSYKHFVGNHEETHRVEQNTEVINNDNSINLGLNYSFNNRFSAALIIPYVFIDRSSLYEHYGNTPGNPRFHTQSQGIGDLRAIGYYNATPNLPNGGLTLGLGVKLPTGDYDATDLFHRRQGDNEFLEERIVDQSIQPGDGGTGIITEFDFYHKISGKIYGYAQGMYMLNPRNTNGVLRSPNPSTNPTTGEVIEKSNEFSVADQYMIRLGARYMQGGLQASFGGRMECIPSKDLADKSQGFRRPGFIISAEPSVFYSFGPHTLGFNFPIAIERNRTRSQIDIARGIEVNPNSARFGKPIQGDAAFADWLLSVTYAYRISL